MPHSAMWEAPCHGSGGREGEESKAMAFTVVSAGRRGRGRASKSQRA